MHRRAFLAGNDSDDNAGSEGSPGGGVDRRELAGPGGNPVPERV
jgi:hypothetical protein